MHNEDGRFQYSLQLSHWAHVSQGDCDRWELKVGIAEELGLPGSAYLDIEVWKPMKLELAQAIQE